MGNPQFGLAEVTEVQFVIGAEAGDVINVQANLLHGASDLDARHLINYWLSSDANGDTLSADPGTVAIGTDGTILAEHVDDIVGMAVSEADGQLDFNITHTGAGTYYLNIALPTGRVVTSPAITFAA